MKAAVIWTKGDWAEYVGTLGFPMWNDALRPCFQCPGFGQDLFNTTACTVLALRWPENGIHDYSQACERCEHTVTIPAGEVADFLGKLRYDKRSGGSRGRALAQSCPRLNLERGDRVEPSDALQDVGSIEDVGRPVTLTMWRVADETLTRHRNPYFQEDLGALPQSSLTVDTLHCLYLGVMNVWCKVALWLLLTCGIYGDMGAAEENLRNALLVLRHSLTNCLQRPPCQGPS